MTDENVSGNESDGMETEVEERSSVPTKEIRKWLGAPEDLYEQLEIYYQNLLIERDALELLVQKQIEHLNKINLLLMVTEEHWRWPATLIIYKNNSGKITHSKPLSRFLPSEFVYYRTR